MAFTPVHIREALARYFGYSGFRGVQQEVIQAILQGHHVLAVLPTGAGKSVCFQLPALMMPGVCLVVTPLIALMRDQVQQLKEKGIPALSLHSGMNGKEIRHQLERAAAGQYRFIYLSPERLQSRVWQEYLPALQINLIAVDEAHCVSQWGYDFRPAYLKIHTLIHSLPGVPVLALTASATHTVREDITDKLGIPEAKWFTQPFARPNLSYAVLRVENKTARLLQVVQSVKGGGLIYCHSRNRCQDLVASLQQQGVICTYYHAGLPAAERSDRQSAWLRGQIPLMVCTSAFGMGINKPDVRLVVHMDMPDSLEAYYQEAGRAGRDGQKSYAVLLYKEEEDDKWAEMQAAQRFPGLDQLRTVYGALASYLQVPAGPVTGEQHPFKILHFATTFQLKLRLVYHVLKTLEQEEYLQFSDPLMQPAKAQVLLSHKEIRSLEEQSHPLEEVVKALLRNYESVLSYPVSIFERQLAKHLRWPEDKVKQQLEAAAQAGFIHYESSRDSPHLCFTGYRVVADTLTINQEAYQSRKKLYLQRLEAMIAYAKADQHCRSVQISAYFSDTAEKSCGICDHCVQSRQKLPTPAEREEYCRAIMQLLHTRQHSTPPELEFLLRPVMSARHFWTMMDWLQQERMVEVLPTQEIRVL